MKLSLCTLVSCVLVGLGSAQDVFGVDYFSGHLYRIDPGTGSGSLVGPTGFTQLNSMARDSLGTFYSAAADPDGDWVIAIDPASASSVALVQTDQSRINSMAFGPNDRLFVTSITSFGVFEVDLGTGTSTLVGNLFCPSKVGLAYGNGRLYGWSLAAGLFEFDLASGSCTIVNPGAGTFGANIQCLAFDDAGNLYGAQDALYSIDVDTGVPTLVGSGGYADLRGIELTPTSTGSTYCTAKPNPCGGLPAISGKGTPSASAPSGFAVQVAGAVPNERAVLLYSVFGPANQPFQGGTLCVGRAGVNRTVRTAPAAGTPGLCDAKLGIDMNAFAQGLLGGKPQPFLRQPGTTVYGQFWGYENGSNLLSDGLMYVVGP